MESNIDIFSDSDFISGKLWTAEDEEEYHRNIRSMEDSLEIAHPNTAVSQLESPALFSAASKEESAVKVSSYTEEDQLQTDELGLLNTVELTETYRFSQHFKFVRPEYAKPMWRVQK